MSVTLRFVRTNNGTTVQGAAVAAGSASASATGALGGASTLVFSSDWGYATGQSLEALSDGTTGVGGTRKWGTIYGYPTNSALTMNVVTTASSPAPFVRKPNALRITQRGALYNGTCFAEGVLPYGESTFGEVFILNAGDTSVHNHPLTYNLIGGFQAIPLAIFADATNWYPAIRSANSSFPRIQWSPGVVGVGAISRLSHNTWYRWRWHIDHYDPVNPTRYRIYPYVYPYDNANPTVLGTPLFTPSTFFQQDYLVGPTNDESLADYYAEGGYFDMPSLTLAQNIGFGQEGSGGAADTGNHWYAADFTIRTGGWSTG